MRNAMLQRRLMVAVLMATFTSGCIQNLEGHPKNYSNNMGEPAPAAEGFIVHIDPVTGDIIAPPTGALPGQVPQPTTQTAKPLPELKPTPSPVPGGGVMIELDKRFHNPLTATIDADGQVRFQHKPNTSGARE